MAILIECPRCKNKQSARARKCRKCDIDLTKVNEKNYISSLVNAEPGLEERIKQAEDVISKTK